MHAVIYAVKLLVQQAGHVGADKQRDYKVKDIQQSFVYAVAGKRFFLHGLPFSDGCYIIICSCFDILLSSQLKVKLRILKYTNCFMEDA